MTEPAMLLAESDSPEIGRITKLLRFFGVEYRTVTSAELLSRVSSLNGAATRSRGLPSDDAEGFRLLCSSDDLEKLIGNIASSSNGMQWWQQQVHSAFVYSSGDFKKFERVVRDLGSNIAILRESSSGPVDFTVTEQLDEFCEVMAGVSGRRSPAAVGGCNLMQTASADVVDIISTHTGSVFSKLNHHGVPVFVSTCEAIVDLDATLPNGIFDIRDHILSALPIVLYIKWAFSRTCWNGAETNACLVIDDPLLKPDHGFINFEKLLGEMQQRRFSTSVAFIPWNSRRNAGKTVELFKDNPNYLSLSVHGYDHGRAEFGTENLAELTGRAERAIERMNDHARITGLGYDRVMVFPQGVFSKAACTALEQTGFIAAVNNDTIDHRSASSEVSIADFWDTAVMRYDNFPIFTRRYPWEGLANFAFDALLGKPAVAVIHHDYCSDGYQNLGNFVDGLNRLNCSISWRTLGNTIRRSYRQRMISTDSVAVQMYATELFLENKFDRAMRYLVRRRASHDSAIKEIRRESGPIDWKLHESAVSFDVCLEPGEATTISMVLQGSTAKINSHESLPYKAKIAVRRFLCEFRDNYWHTFRHRFMGGPGGINYNLTNSGRRVQVEQSLFNFAEWLSRYGETSWDHQSFFAGPVGGLAKSLYYRNRLVGTAAVAPMIFAEAFVPSARRLFHHPARFPIADAHYAMGFAFLYEQTGDLRHLERALHFLNELVLSRCSNFKELCWGYPFDWVWRGGVIKEGTPLITTTPYCYEAFLQVYQLLGRSEHSTFNLQPSTFRTREDLKAILASIARHAANDLKDFPTSATASSCSYTPDDEGGVINAAAYRAFLLTSASQVFSNEAYSRIADRNLNFVLENQNADGSWFYATDGVRDFVDHYHTCFVMKALAKIHKLTGNDRCLDALSRGVEYYLNNLFAEDGLPKPFSKAPRLTVYKRELYDCAECINLCVLLRDRFPQLQNTLDTVITGLLDNWVKSDGSFRSRRLHFGWDNVPMHRWGQSQMFRALAFYLCDERRNGVSQQPNSASDTSLVARHSSLVT